ncbi:hypothetical protein ZOSMA_31G00410 [Zostera marina]|uniref:Uncharacterized protein n=1 Tax=Zostera marina TaxID=29655 RepID=A0A0K9P8X3_ZOSMR|nr:hypothetical protein ZOSMA_31G00410 [Zostera marina]
MGWLDYPSIFTSSPFRPRIVLVSNMLSRDKVCRLPPRRFVLSSFSFLCRRWRIEVCSYHLVVSSQESPPDSSSSLKINRPISACLNLDQKSDVVLISLSDSDDGVETTSVLLGNTVLSPLNLDGSSDPTTVLHDLPPHRNTSSFNQPDALICSGTRTALDKRNREGDTFCNGDP